MAGRITIVGLGPGDFERIPSEISRVLLDPDATVIVRTLQHPAARRLSQLATTSTSLPRRSRSSTGGWLNE